MSDGEFWTYTGLLGLSGLVLLALGVAGLGQSGFLRGVDALLGLGFLGYAGYLGVARPDDTFTFWAVFALPVLALIHASVCLRREMRLRRIAAKFTPDPYAEAMRDAQTERQPFPAAPGPLPEPPTAAPSAQAEVRRGPMPSGLPRPPAADDLAAPSSPAAPSDLSGGEAAGYTGRHSANSDERFPQSPGYAARSYENRPEGGRHRAPETDDSPRR
ncbi:hypothetical protein Ade02nite_53870 [Paractinoplanes deccanensis]|uniref:Integral membrane protein n=1 Tax=Paractinoplanes deccanensis TaxID=113561 RepID=A0ABQ3Y9R2_9ACTN|nr:hypothetical protein [Actinoplanes deccanensis]GID76746.1 hypothetical protein Ade02nite_53870 [Actinoplanes deccanensis]